MSMPYKEFFIYVNASEFSVHFSSMIRQNDGNSTFQLYEWDCLALSKALGIKGQAQWGVSFSPRVVCILFFSERGFNP
ncbi:hypothetical protein [Sphingobium sp. AP50]|uniref:hypothetical protein n=1 Tax=Sphingobium sp. AP50 TaxID=1884369 RepID=UPI001160B7FB|nr:hypothetical protein [Sphingobium sp. AP50]